MTTHPPHVVTDTGGCVVCGGPCREPFTLPPIHPSYPFLPAAVIEATNPEHGPPVPVEPPPARARRLRNDRMKRPETHERGGEDR